MFIEKFDISINYEILNKYLYFACDEKLEREIIEFLLDYLNEKQKRAIRENINIFIFNFLNYYKYLNLFLCDKTVKVLREITIVFIEFKIVH